MVAVAQGSVLSALVKLAHDKIKAVNPRIEISASTICYGGAPKVWVKTTPYASVLQDWYLWMRQGWIDTNIPLNYRTEKRASQARAFRDWIENSEAWNGGRPVYQGLYSDENSVENTIKQIEATRKAHQEGFVLFSFKRQQRRDAMLAPLGAALGAAPKLRVNERWRQSVRNSEGNTGGCGETSMFSAVPVVDRGQAVVWQDEYRSLRFWRSLSWRRALWSRGNFAGHGSALGHLVTIRQSRSMRTVAAAKKAGINALFIQVRKNADSYSMTQRLKLGARK